MRKIKLSMGLFAQVDDEDFDRLNQWKWHAYKSGNSYYAKRTSGEKLHYAVFGKQDGKLIDHKDRNGLNNQKFNLRFCTKSQNLCNRRAMINGSSKYLGVYKRISKNKYRSKATGKIANKQWAIWVATINTNGKQIKLGSFKNEWDAANAYNLAAKKYHGEFANLNKKNMDDSRSYTEAKLYSAKGDISKKWYVYFFYRNPSDGKMLMFKKTAQINYIHNSKKRLREGSLLVEEINKLLKRGWSPLGNSNLISLIEHLEKMFEVRKHSLRPRSITSYKYCLDNFKSFLEKKNIAHILPEQFDIKLCHSFCDWLQIEKGIKARNFNNHKILIGALFNMLEDREIIIKNPFRKIKSFEKIPASNTPFTDKQREIISGAMMLHDYRLWVFKECMYFLFTRPAETLKLKPYNFDLTTWQVRLESWQTKTKKPRTVIIPDAFKPTVKQMELDKIPKDYFIFGNAGKYNTLEPSPVALTRNVATQRHLKIMRELKMPKELTLYSWRDTGAVNAWKAGIDIIRISQQLGHRSITTTEIYLNSIRSTPNLEFGSKMK